MAIAAREEFETETRGSDIGDFDGRKARGLLALLNQLKIGQVSEIAIDPDVLARVSPLNDFLRRAGRWMGGCPSMFRPGLGGLGADDGKNLGVNGSELAEGVHQGRIRFVISHDRAGGSQ